MELKSSFAVPGLVEPTEPLATFFTEGPSLPPKHLRAVR